MFYERAAYVDRVYAKLATSLISGPLSKLKHAKCHTIKVATADTLESPSTSGQRREPTALICLFFDNVWDAAHAREVLECVVKEHGEMPNSAKADLYTLAGLDSHVSQAVMAARVCACCSPSDSCATYPPPNSTHASCAAPSIDRRSSSMRSHSKSGRLHSVLD